VFDNRLISDGEHPFEWIAQDRWTWALGSIGPAQERVNDHNCAP
jgi:hypothetical protein